MKAVSFYHNDMDGKASGYIVHKCMVEPWGLKESIDNYHMKSYDDPFIMDNIDKDTVVFITDLSFSESTVNQLLEICDKAAYVIWIDHHLTSMKLIDNYMFPVDRIKNLISLIDMNGCGALLTYLVSKFSFEDIIKCSGMLNSIGCTIHINKNIIPSANICCYINRDDYNMITMEIPKWLVYIDDRDRWIKQFPETDNFISGCDIYNTSLFEMNSFTGSRVWNKFWGRLIII